MQVAKEDKRKYQKTIIGGFSDAFHFYPVICCGNKATVYLHNNMLEYGHEYEIKISKGVIEGWNDKKAWTFRTKKNAPSADLRHIVVAADGSGDFSTLQGAMDWIPDSLPSETDRKTVFVKNGDYEEICIFPQQAICYYPGRIHGWSCGTLPKQRGFQSSSC